MLALLFNLMTVTSCGWTRYPSIKIETFNTSKSHLSISTEDFKHIKYQNAVDLKLHYVDRFSDSMNVSEYKQINDTELYGKGCSIIDRRLRVEELLQIQLPDDDKFQFTDFVIYNDTAFLLRNDNRIFQISLEYNNFDLQKLVVQSRNLDFSSIIKHSQSPKMLLLNSIILIITENGFLSFDTNEWTQTNFPKLSSHQSDNVTVINQVYYDITTNRIFVVSGTQGIQVYKFNNELSKLYTINLNKNLLRVQIKDDLLFVLDDKVGIHFIQLSDQQYNIQEFLIPLENAISFVYNNNSFLVIAQTNDKIIFGIEILIQFKNQEFYYNKFYLEDMQLKDVQNSGNYQYLIGYDVHKIVQTNIYRGFVDEEFDYDTDFMVPLLQKIIKIPESDFQKANYGYHHSLALTPHYLYALITKDRNKEIICSSSRSIEQSYYVVMNSTICPNALDNPFLICQEEHQFQLKVNEVLLDSQSQWYAEVFLVIIFVIFLLLLICGILMCRKWRQIMANVQLKLKLAEQKKKQYQNLQMA